MESVSKRVLLANLPFYRLLGSHYNGLNLGLAYISSSLKAAGHESAIYNADFIDSRSYASQRDIISHKDEYLKIHREPEHPVWLETVSRILDYKPDFLGLSIFTANLRAAAIVAGHVRRLSPDVRIVIGGPHATLAGATILEEIPEADFVLSGEGEISFPKLVSGAVPASIPGLSYRDGGRIVEGRKAEPVGDLDTLPFPDRDSFHPAGNVYESNSVMTSRGCPNNCAFCASPVIWDRKVRFRSSGNIMDELDLLKRRGVRELHFCDDTFTFNKRRLMSVLDGMIERSLGFEWICDTRLNCLDREILEKMKEAGCVRVKFGVESGSERVLREISKGITREMALEKSAVIRELGLSFAAYFMIGFPDETDGEARQTIELARSIGADYYSLSILSPYFGTDIYSRYIGQAAPERLKHHWEYFFHQNSEMLLTSKIKPETVAEFLSLNEYGKGSRL